MTRHNLVVARNTTLEEVSCKVNEYSVSENTLYRATSKVAIFSNIYQKSTKTTPLACDMLYVADTILSIR